MVKVRGTDGDCIYQCDETCHAKEIQIDDWSECKTRRIE